MKWFKKRESELMKLIKEILSRPKKGNPHRHDDNPAGSSK